MQKEELETGNFPHLYQLLENSESKREELASYPSMIWKTVKRAGKMLLSFTYSAQLPLLLAFMGHLSEDPDEHTKYLAAATLAVTVFDTGVLIPGVISFATMLVGGKIHGEMKQAESMEEEVTDHKKSFERIVKTSYLLAAPLIGFSMVVLVFSKSILVNLFGQDEEVAELAQQFLRLAALVIPLTTLRFILQQIFFTHEEQTGMTVTSIVGFLVGGVFLSYGFGYGINSNWVSLPAKGMQGIFFGVLTENIISTVGVSACLYSRTFKDYHFARSFLSWNQQDRKQIFELMKQAIPIELSYLSELATLLIKTLLAGYLGKSPLAAQNFAGQISLLALLIAHVLSQATSLNVSDTQYKARFAWAGIIASLLVSGLICVPIGIFPQILTVFLSSSITDEVMKLARILVPLAAGTSVLNTVSLTMLQTLRRKEGHIKFTIIFNAWLWAGTLGSYILGFPLELGATGIGISSLFGAAAATGHLGLCCQQEFKLEEKVNNTVARLPKLPSRSLLIQQNNPPRPSSFEYGFFNRIVDRCKSGYYDPSAENSFTV